MTSVRKRDGSVEEFNRDKLEVSLLNAAVTAPDVVAIAEKVQASASREINTREIRRQVIAELRRVDTAAAKRYEEFKQITA